MPNHEAEDNRTYKVVVNHEEQYSIWFFERPNPLAQAVLDHLPFASGDDPWHQIEWKEALGPFVTAVDGKGDALLEERAIGPDLVVAQRSGRRPAHGAGGPVRWLLPDARLPFHRRHP